MKKKNSTELLMMLPLLHQIGLQNPSNAYTIRMGLEMCGLFSHRMREYSLRKEEEEEETVPRQIPRIKQ